MKDLKDKKIEVWNTRIRSCLKKAKLTEKQLANKMNEKYDTSITQKTVSSWLNVGEKRSHGYVGFPKMESIFLIADFFNVDIGYLMGETDEESFTMEKAEKYLSLSREALKTIIDITHPTVTQPSLLTLEIRRSFNYLLSSFEFKEWFLHIHDVYESSPISNGGLKTFGSIEESQEYVEGPNENMSKNRYLAFEAYISLMDTLYPYYNANDYLKDE